MIPAYFSGAAGAEKAARRILIAEDEFLLRLDAADSMRRFGWDVVEVSSADEAIELLRYNVTFDILLTDIDMPGQADGLDLARYVRLHHPEMKIAIMSGNSEAQPIDPKLCELFLVKPVWNVAEMLTKVIEGDQNAK
ncbi:response regulator [Aliirhizobium smilacinae]|uniref:Response regulator n=1 Tax=Aliirhizobium smilacinae TaxID=1395944 RepID=A0A5C4XN90_9HYPH|nr:response regulator [Rhizobium smilacinae]TNM63974.1 response regulator [Rhizobium smilacinae]